MDETAPVIEDLPMFPLGAVLFPGIVLPLHVFEPRYRAMVGHLLGLPAHQRHFGSVAIREGYEVGEHGKQELYRVGCRLQLTDITAHSDGTYDLTATCMDRIRLLDLDARGSFPTGRVTLVADEPGQTSPELVESASRDFATYREALHQVRGDPLPQRLPQDPEFLAWVMAAASPVTMPDKQRLLEASHPAARLELAAALFREEVRVMTAIPSLPATELARTRWSPN
ncbi:MAG: LON peptidase substrate-binding domain-containing protein [Nocardioides sp.]